MLPRVVEARWVSGYTVWLHFADGAAGEVDLADQLWGPMFEPLCDVERFREVALHPELRTIVWPNGADLAPELLYERVRVTA
jgi:hypothetical protein